MSAPAKTAASLGRAGSAGKVLRTALRGLLQKASDSRVSSRLTAEMIRVVKADTTSDRGLRNAFDGEVEMLQGFELNGSGLLTGTLFAPYDVTIDRMGGAHQVNLAGFVPGAAVAAPSGATHCKIIAAETLTRIISQRLAKRGITINAVNLGPTDTGWMDDELKAGILAKSPMGRIGMPSDAARLIGFLASDAAEWVTGQVMHSEGGFVR